VGDTITFDGSGSSDPDGTIVSYDWDFGDGNSGAGVGPTHTYTVAGVYTVTLTVTDDDGASSSCTTTASIEANLPPICDAGGPYFGDEGMPLQFDGSGSSDPDGTIVAYDWDFGDGTTGTGVTPSHTYTLSGLYVVTLCVTDDDGAVSCCDTEAEISGPVPVAFSGFEAVSMAGEVHLSWRTSLEFAFARFNVYRRDPQALDYAKLNDVWVEPTGANGTLARYVDAAVVTGKTYEYRIEIVDTSGAREISQPVRVTVTREVAARPILHQNHPNPFNPLTTITFMVPEVSSVKLAIFDARGRLVRILVDAVVDPGIHLAEWDGRDQRGGTVSSGVYIYRLEVGGTNLTKRMVLVR
jgi:chitodextrinase